MNVKVDEKACSGCGLCADICPEVFELSDGIAKVAGAPETGDVEETCREAAKNCPVEAIEIEA